ncbi:Ger(x)C family spore germination protein [Paenibacillus sp. MBLB4367]|uniref:Ger(x)C family spore germination protein n=1 Tax=Paenibacillus sp. MBLB4367 TaxID=3384767 RepID=UPI0039083E9E
MNKRYRLSVSIVGVLFLLTGCTADQRVIGKIGLVNTIGYDAVSGENGHRKLQATIFVPKISDAKKNQVLTATAKSTRDAMFAFTRKTDDILEMGQIRNVLFGIDFAKQGIDDMLLNLSNTPTVGARVKVIIVAGTAQEVIGHSFKEYPDAGQYITRLLKKEFETTDLPETNICSFRRDMYDDGMDAIAPIIKLGKDELIIDGVALFDEDRYMAKLNPEQASFLYLLNGKLSRGELRLTLPSGDFVSLGNIDNRRKVTVNLDDPEHFRADVSITVAGEIGDFPVGASPGAKQTQLQFEQAIAEQIEREAHKVIKLVQSHRVDSIGIGHYVRNKMSYGRWTKLDWGRRYAEMKISCHVKVKIKSVERIMKG